MSIDLMTEILAAHADRLNRDEPPAPGDAERGDALPAQRAELDALMQTATRAKRAFAPVALAPTFRAHLRDGLTMAARYKESQKISLASRESAWGWVIGAAALGSAAGLIALAWRARRPREAGETERIAPGLEKPVGQPG